MRSKVLSLFVLFLLLTVFPSSADHGNNDLIIRDAWVRATTLIDANSLDTAPEVVTPMTRVSAAYMTIENHGQHSIRLISAATNSAAIVEIHEMQIQNDVMLMRPVEGGIVIPSGESAVLAPGGFHIMLFDLQHELVEGEAISLTLIFEMLTGEEVSTREPLALVIGLVITSEPPQLNNFVAINASARPTMLDATPEAFTESIHTGADVSAIYMTLFNIGVEGDRLVSGATPAAGIVEIHEMTLQGDIMRMRPINGIDIPSGGEVVLEPGGLHIMLMDLHQSLVVGEAIVLTLSFESGAEIKTAIPIYDPLIDGS